MYIIKTYEYSSSLNKLIRKLRISSTNKNVLKKLKVLVAFLSNQRLEGNQASSFAPFFLKIIRSELWENLLANKINTQISFIIHLRRAKIKICIN